MDTDNRGAPKDEAERSIAVNSVPVLSTTVILPLSAANDTNNVSHPLIVRMLETSQQMWPLPVAIPVPMPPAPQTNPEGKKRRQTGNGLRQFAEFVLRKVERKGTTTYGEVADELVSDMYRTTMGSGVFRNAASEEKNIRRRVYDALNVLLALKIIRKDRKLIHWSGMPSSQSEQLGRLQKQKRDLKRRVEEKKQELNELIVQLVSFSNLIERNRERGLAVESERLQNQDECVVRLPFIVVNTRKYTSIDCWTSETRDTYLFSFNERFEMHDDVEVLKRCGMAMGLQSGSFDAANLDKVFRIVGVNLRPYVLEMMAKSLPNNPTKIDFHAIVDSSSVLSSTPSATVVSKTNEVVGASTKDKPCLDDSTAVVTSQTLYDIDVSSLVIVEPEVGPGGEGDEADDVSLSDDSSSNVEDVLTSANSEESDVEPF